MTDEKDIYFIEKQSISIGDFECADSWILDIGGGGEGIIGQIKGSKVVAIDIRESELEEASGDSLKILMDARDMKFLNKTFDTITAFFSLMYVKPDELELIFKEANRVLKPDGIFLIWDAIFFVPKDSTKKFIGLYLDILLPNEKLVETGYATKIHNQNGEEIGKIAKENGFNLIENKKMGKTFFLKLKKS